MTSFSPTTPVADLVTDRPARARILERLGIDDMIGEHDEAGAALDRLRTLTNDYTRPTDACPTFRAALDGLNDLDRDLHRHVRKENNILFPRARALA